MNSARRLLLPLLLLALGIPTIACSSNQSTPRDSGQEDAALDAGDAALDDADVLDASEDDAAAPNSPSTPASPLSPSTPLSPLSPSTPLSPLSPNSPSTPDSPLSPITPAGPDSPNTPAAPAAPAAPVAVGGVSLPADAARTDVQTFEGRSLIAE